MKSLTPALILSIAIANLAGGGVGGQALESRTNSANAAANEARSASEPSARLGDPSGIRIETPVGVQKPPFDFSTDDEALLDEVQRASFRYLWEHASPVTGMVHDRSSQRFVSVAGVGFQLSAIPIGIERGWITHRQGEDRAVRILRALRRNEDNRWNGLYFHFLDETTAGPYPQAYEHVVSTIDSALLFAGAMTAGSYFGGETAQHADAMLLEANWSAFEIDPGHGMPRRVSLGYQAPKQDGETGELMPYSWGDSGDEQRLVMFLAVAAQDPEHALPAKRYYQMRRSIGEHADNPIVWFPYSGALFTSFFAHCWIDHRSAGLDDPALFGVQRRARVDWWENSRRHVRMHRDKAIEMRGRLQTPGPNAWGLTACDGPDGYAVPGLFPKPVRYVDEAMHLDIPFMDHPARDNWMGGLIAPYAAAASMMFEPELAIDALRHYRGLRDELGEPMLWNDTADGGFGFVDAYSLDQDPPWIAHDTVAIDAGPTVLGIENARSGLVWSLFAAHPVARRGYERLGMDVPVPPRSWGKPLDRD